MNEAEAEALARAEGLELKLSKKGKSGFSVVYPQGAFFKMGDLRSRIKYVSLSGTCRGPHIMLLGHAIFLSASFIWQTAFTKLSTDAKLAVAGTTQLQKLRSI